MSMSFFWQFVLVPCFAASFAAISAAPFGAIISWRKLVYFGEALSHSAWLGIAIALFFNLPIYVGIWLTTALLIALLFLLKNKSNTDSNNILGTLSHGMLAFGVIALAKMENIRRDLFTYLFGDILNTTSSDLILICLVSSISLFILYFLWNSIILLTVSEAIAHTEIVKIKYIEAIFLVLLGIFTGIMMQFLGLMLIMSFLIIPVQAAAKIAKTPEQCIFFAAMIAVICVYLGILSAFIFDFPVAPAIVAVMIIPYFFLYFCKKSA
ncbi:MAG: metal ABC transporter permease [Cardiobacteriaceae bacterium]|nr:metal ABC transporter permease [Cardiobacteriaceae bacterium]